MKTPTYKMLAVASLLGVCGIAEDRIAADEPAAAPIDRRAIEGRMIESRVLRAEFPRLVADALKWQEERGRPMPPGWKHVEFVPKLIEEMKKDAPNLFLVLPEDERRFTEGRFDDAAAKRIEQTVKILKDFQIEPSWLGQYVVDRHRAKKLSGIRLEVASRALLPDIAKLIRKVNNPGNKT